MPSIFICSTAKQCLHWLRLILCVHWNRKSWWKIGSAEPKMGIDTIPNTNATWILDIVNGPLSLNCRPFFLVQINFPILQLFFLSTHILRQSLTMGHAKRTNEQSKWTKYYDFICNMADAQWSAEATAAAFVHLRLVRLIEPDEMCLLCIGRFRCPHSAHRQADAHAITTTFPVRPTRAASHCERSQ